MVIVVLRLIRLEKLEKETRLRRSESHSSGALFICPKNIPICALNDRRNIVELDDF
jgi:hypothetical protein